MGARSRRDELGIFANFSPIVHGIAKTSFTCHTHDAQQVLLNLFEELNGHQEARTLSIGAGIGEVAGTMRFEVGLAEGSSFVYFDDETSAKLASFLELQKRTRPLDFLLIATYHYTKKEKEIPLKFDYHHLRFLFGQNEMNLVLHHVRGTRRLPLDELLRMLFERFERKVKEKHLGTFMVRQIRTA